MIKIAMIGGGSLLWTPILVTDLALTPEIDHSTIVLHDIDADALGLMQKLAQRICQATSTNIKIEATTDRHHALEGADFVSCAIGVGGLDAMRIDLEAPARYGFMQPVSSNVGPGGINRALRHIPVILDICKDMERECPGAWLLNLTNPMTQTCWAAARETSVRVIGLCHEISGVRNRLAERIFNTPPEELWMQAAGINHLPWILEFRVGNEDGFPLLRDWLEEYGPLHFAKEDLDNSLDSVFRDRMGVKLNLFQATGVLPGAGDRHVAEFYPHFIRQETHWGLDYGVELTTIEHRKEIEKRRESEIKRWLSGESALPLHRSYEQLASIIAALSGGQAGRFIVNIPNEGQISNLPTGAVVECFATIDRFGVHPEFVGPLPPHAQAVAAWHLQEMALTVEAALTGDRSTALQALCMDPAVTDWQAAPKLLDELIAGTSAYIPQF